LKTLLITGDADAVGDDAAGAPLLRKSFRPPESLQTVATLFAPWSVAAG
jgi:hypothetical protein